MASKTAKTRMRKLNDWFEHVLNEIVYLYVSRQIYKETLRIVQENLNLQDANQLFLNWVAYNYTASILLKVRILVDHHRGTKSFVLLLEELKKNPTEIFPKENWQAWVLGGVHTGMDLDSEFDYDSTKNQESDPATILQSDIDTLKNTAKNLIEYVEQRLAHYDINARNTVKNFSGENLEKEMPPVVDLLVDLLQKYHRLFRDGPLIGPPWQVQDDWKKIFYLPWIPTDQAGGNKKMN